MKKIIGKKSVQCHLDDFNHVNFCKKSARIRLKYCILFTKFDHQKFNLVRTTWLIKMQNSVYVQVHDYLLRKCLIFFG